MLNGSSDRNRAQLWGSEGWFGLKDSSHGIWAFFQFSNQLAVPMILLGCNNCRLAFMWDLPNGSFGKHDKIWFTRITSRIDKAIGCNWTLETPKGESIETYRTFWRIQVCKQIAKLLCLQTGRVATCKGMRWCLFSCCNSIFQWLLTCAACCLLASSDALQQS